MNLKYRILAGLTALALVGSASATHAACSGDVNGDTHITVADVQALLKCNGTRTSPPANPNPAVCNPLCGGHGVLDCGDLNLDGQITTADAILALNESAEHNSRRNVVPICTSVGPTVACGTTMDAADSSNINSNRVLAACEYKVSGTVFVQPGVVLTIRPGAVIKGIAGASTPSGLIFLPGDDGHGNLCPVAGATRLSARINAAGTPTAPILFTSDQPAGSRRSGDWAGVAFNGCSRVNDTGGTSEAEGLIGVVFGGGTDCKPGTQFEEGHTPSGAGATADCADSSGLMRYARIEFAGNELSPDNELNSLTQNALGNHTNFSYLQTHMGLDDNFEWFGGTILEHHFVSTGARDDNFDWQLGSDIKLQYGVAAQYLPNLDALSDHGFEGDNNERGFGNLEPSTPQFCNITVIGAKGQTGTIPSGGSWYGALLRRGTPARIAKTILTNFISGGFTLRDVETGQHACQGTCKYCKNTVPVSACPNGDSDCGGSGNCVTRTNGDLLLTCASGANTGKVCTVATSTTDCLSAGLCTAKVDCPGFTLVDTDPFDTTCSAGTKVGQTCSLDSDCPGGGTCGYNNLLITHSLFYDNGDGDTTHGSVSGGSHITTAIVKTGGNNSGGACNSQEWLDLLVATESVKRNTTFPDAATDPGISTGAGSFWPPSSFVPSHASVVADAYDCADMSTFFDTTSYMGAFDPAGTDWTQTPGHCSTATGTSCTTGSDCPAGEYCVRWLSYTPS